MSQIPKTVQKKLDEKKQKKNNKKLGKEHRFGVILAWIVVVIFLFGGIRFLLTENTLLKQTKQEAQALSQQKQAIQNIKNSASNVGNLDAFNKEFIQKFYDGSNNEDDYQKAIKPYFAENTVLPSNQTKKNKQVNDIKLWQQEKDNDVYHLKYLISYSIQEDKKHHKNGEEILSYDVKQDGNSFVVTTMPIKEAKNNIADSSIAKADVLPEIQTEDQVSDKEAQKIKKWLDQTFLPKYFANTSSEDMNYLMKNGQALGGVLDYVSIEKMLTKKGAEQDTIYLIVNTKDTESGQEYQQHYQLSIGKNDKGNYQINRLTNHF